MTISGYLQRFNTIVANQLAISHNHAHLQRQAQEVSMNALPSGRVTLTLHPLLIVAAIVPPGKVETLMKKIPQLLSNCNHLEHMITTIVSI